MKFLLRKCPNCGRYTLRESCPACNTRTVCPHPPRFSPIDRYVDYRIAAKYGTGREDG
ncbi:MAG: RNA-protein complex protein Nop10 [Zestosphaera sp.]